MTTSRQKILAYFAKARSASARQIARSLKMSPATVRHHLRIMASDGRLELTSAHKPERKGRPDKVYALPRAALGDNLAALSGALLEEAGPTLPMEVLAGYLVGEANFTSQPLAKRLNLTADKLNQMNYHARWEAGSEGPRIVFGHCPYAAVLEKHPGLCQMDQSMLKELMGQPARQVLRTGKDGSSVCVFVIGK